MKTAPLTLMKRSGTPVSGRHPERRAGPRPDTHSGLYWTAGPWEGVLQVKSASTLSGTLPSEPRAKELPYTNCELSQKKQMKYKPSTGASGPLIYDYEWS